MFDIHKMTSDKSNLIIGELKQIVDTANHYIVLFEKGENEMDTLKMVTASLNNKTGLTTLRELSTKNIISVVTQEEAPVTGEGAERRRQLKIAEIEPVKRRPGTDVTESLKESAHGLFQQAMNDPKKTLIRSASVGSKLTNPLGHAALLKDVLKSEKVTEVMKTAAKAAIAPANIANEGGKPKPNVKYISTKTKTDVKMKSGSFVSRTIYYKEGDKKETKYVKINSEYVKYNSKKKY